MTTPISCGYSPDDQACRRTGILDFVCLEHWLICFQDLAIATANEKGAPYVLAQDPDADRFSAAENWYV
jgi:hypothetical protein